ncbi:flavodoxin domain-containing protein [Canibacter zhoujuaniae]|uniref:flavodoxin domain-containing protein n=1 Tax=Canibacter zhoujuaniae TaxID=2708343 RepID=UPI0014207484|nr:flavodoxin domain-containing protein [Canibacter zhoujuaniae]
MAVRILFGTESGNAELVASDIEDALAAETSEDLDVDDLANVDVNAFNSDDRHLIICSTHGEGDLPYSAQPFVAALENEKPDLTGVRFAVFGLGDSTYENYSKGSERVVAALESLGASRVGEYGRHDAASPDDASDLAVAWAPEALAAFE